MTPTSNTKTGCYWKQGARNYRVMRVAEQDYCRNLTREKIDEQCNRATPREWAGSLWFIFYMAIKVVETGFDDLIT